MLNVKVEADFEMSNEEKNVVGIGVGLRVVGKSEGAKVGGGEGRPALVVGCEVVGNEVGIVVGEVDGGKVGWRVGLDDGRVGVKLGRREGLRVGVDVGGVNICIFLIWLFPLSATKA